MRDILEAVVVLLGALLIAGALVGVLIIGLAYTFGPPFCRAPAEKMGIDHDWGFWSGCMVEIEPGKWVPLETYRLTEERE